MDQTLDVEIPVPLYELGPVRLLPIFDTDTAEHFFEFLLDCGLLENFQITKSSG